MVDEQIVVVGVGAYLGLKEVAPRLLGPTADYLGQGLRLYTEKGAENLRRIFVNGIKKAGKKVDEPGQVPAKVVKEVLEAGYFAEDELAAEYFGGVLASSRTGIARDDRGASYCSLIQRLSSYQLRTHYFVYAGFKHVFNECGANLGSGDERLQLRLFVPSWFWVSAMDFTEEEDQSVIFSHVLHGLLKEELIEQHYHMGTNAFLKQRIGYDPQTSGFVVSPSVIGVELFLWAHGCGQMNKNKFLTHDFGVHPVERFDFDLTQFDQAFEEEPDSQQSPGAYSGEAADRLPGNAQE